MTRSSQDKERLLKRSRVFCMLPWASLSLQPSGDVYPCCVAQFGRPVGNLAGDSLAALWNSPDMRQIRLNMLSGVESPQCARCYQLERSGSLSLRGEMNERFAHHFSQVETTRPDGAVPKCNLAYLDVRFSNICNFKCRYCCIDLSSAWYPDYLQVAGGPPERPLRRIGDGNGTLWQELEALVPDLEWIYFTGGEPLISPEHYRLLQSLIAKGRRDVHLLYSTNFSLTEFRRMDVFSLWKHFKHVHVAASLDGSGARGEYIRKNQNWQAAVKNRERMLRVCPGVAFNLAPTLSVMNVLHLPDFHWEWLQEGYIGPQDLYINILLAPEEYCVQILPGGLKAAVREKYERHIARMEARYGADASAAAAHFRSALNFMLHEDRSALLPRFRETTAQLDRIRGERFAEIFPELGGLMGTAADTRPAEDLRRAAAR